MWTWHLATRWNRSCWWWKSRSGLLWTRYCSWPHLGCVTGSNHPNILNPRGRLPKLEAINNKESSVKSKAQIKDAIYWQWKGTRPAGRKQIYIIIYQTRARWTTGSDKTPSISIQLNLTIPCVGARPCHELTQEVRGNKQLSVFTPNPTLWVEFDSFRSGWSDKK